MAGVLPLDVTGAAVSHYFAVIYDADVVAVFCFFEIVGGEKDCGAIVFANMGKIVPEIFSG